MEKVWWRSTLGCLDGLAFAQIQNGHQLMLESYVRILAMNLVKLKCKSLGTCHHMLALHSLQDFCCRLL